MFLRVGSCYIEDEDDIVLKRKDLEKNINLLLNKIKSLNLDAFLVPKGDMFSGEEVPPEEERLKFISNFTGSAGCALISSKSNLKSAIFSDGRYQLQMKNEVDSKYFDLFNGGFIEASNFLTKNNHILKKLELILG